MLLLYAYEKLSKISTAIAYKEGEKARIAAETEIAEFNKDKELKVQAYRKDQETKKAKADLAYIIEENTVKQEVTETEMAVELLRKNKAIEIAEKEAIRRERELEANVKKETEAHVQCQSGKWGRSLLSLIPKGSLHSIYSCLTLVKL